MHERAPILTGIHVYPLKSASGMRRLRARVAPRGLEGDRRWMVVDENGRFVTGREVGRLLTVRARLEGDALVLEAPGREALRTPAAPAAGPRVRVAVWGDECEALAPDPAADAWLGAVLGRRVRLVHMDESCRRPVDPDYGRPGDEVSFADGFPLLLIGQGSLDALNERLAEPVPMLRFRPNLVVGGAPPHAEDRWRRIRIGDVVLDLVKPCSRCVMTTVDPATGERHPGREPLRTLATYRRGTDGGVLFGRNAIPRAPGEIRAGAPVAVLD